MDMVDVYCSHLLTLDCPLWLYRVLEANEHKFQGLNSDRTPAKTMATNVLTIFMFDFTEVIKRSTVYYACKERMFYIVFMSSGVPDESCKNEQ